MTDGVPGKSPLHWPNRALALPSRASPADKGGWRSRLTEGWRKKRSHWKYRWQLVTQGLPPKNEECIESSLLSPSTKVIHPLTTILWSRPHPNVLHISIYTKYIRTDLFRNRTMSMPSTLCNAIH